MFRTLQHQDAHEFLNYLLNKIDELLQKEMEEAFAMALFVLALRSHTTQPYGRILPSPPLTHKCISAWPQSPTHSATPHPTHTPLWAVCKIPRGTRKNKLCPCPMCAPRPDAPPRTRDGTQYTDSCYVMNQK